MGGPSDTCAPQNQVPPSQWFARRPGTLFRALLLSELGGERVEQTFFRAHHFADKHILDPFMGGGTTVVEANRLGCAVRDHLLDTDNGLRAL